jgi:type VI secretion system protein ImpH
MGFFALVSTLERLTPAATRVGGDGPVETEVLRFRNDPSMGFRSGDVTEARVREVARDPKSPWAGRREVVEITTAFLGLTGSVSPLPLHIPAEIAQDASLSSNPQRDFLDVFHHRLVSLLYRLWTRYQYAREFLSDGSDAWSPRVLALCGFDAYENGTRSVLRSESPRLPVPAHELLRLVPLLMQHTRTARTVELALCDLLRDALREDLGDRAVRIEHLTGGLVTLDDAARMRLGTQTSVLGRSSLLGSRAPDRTSGFTVHLQLAAHAELSAFMAGGARLKQLRAVVTHLVRDPLDFDVVVESAGRSAEGFALGRVPLGRATWLRGRGEPRRFTVRGVAQLHSSI